MNERQQKILNAIKNKGNYCSKCNFTWIPFSEYTEDFCPNCEGHKIKDAKELTAKTLRFIDSIESENDIYDTIDDDFSFSINNKPWLEE